MSIVINATPEDPAANSYCTLAYALDYLANQIIDKITIPAWLAATSDDKSRALIMATRVLDETMIWKGFKRTRLRSLRWPRSGVLTPDGFWYDYDTVPDIVQQATAEVAAAYLTKDRRAEPKLIGGGFDQASLAGMSVHVDKSATLGLIPPYTLAKLQRVGMHDSLGGPGGARMVDLVR